MKTTVNGLRLELGQNIEKLPGKAAKKLGIRPGTVVNWRLVRRSLDARKKKDIHYVCSVEISTDKDDSGFEDAIPGVWPEQIDPDPALCRPVIAGFGPAGMFAALFLARAGLRPIVIERGQQVEKRIDSVEKFRRTGVLNPESNAQFGEGGAGTFSDGKLNTGTRDSRIGAVLGEFYRHGAQESVLWDAKPHIGTDVLTGIVRSFRNEIISLGGEVRFENTLTGINVSGQTLKSIMVRAADGEYELPCNNLILAIGHSARDTVAELFREGVPMERKAFSMGARIEHLQSRINSAQYGADRTDLPPADYSLAVHLPDGNSAYTFCMCPGGYVFSAASEKNGVCTNGMSYSGRAGENANSALLVTLLPEDFPGTGPLAGMEWQKEIERKAYRYGKENGEYYATAQLVGDFLKDVPSKGFGSVKPTYIPGVRWGDIREILPEKISAVIASALPELDRKLPGFADPDAVLTAPETRSSSPVRILRRDSMESDISGLFPCGEGAGYAGGITSAAVDGLRCAEALLNKIK